MRSIDFIIKREEHEAAAELVAEAGPQSDNVRLENMRLRSWLAAGSTGKKPERGPVVDFLANPKERAAKWEIETAARVLNTHVRSKGLRSLEFRVYSGAEGKDPHVRIHSPDHRTTREFDADQAEVFLREAVKEMSAKRGRPLDLLGEGAETELGRLLPRDADNTAQVVVDGQKAVEELLATLLPKE